LLLDEINQRTKLNEPIGNFDLIAISDRLAASARNSLHVKQAQRSWDTFRKRIREHFPKRQFAMDPSD
jgi:hypothetical protein